MVDLTALSPIQSTAFADGWAVFERGTMVEFAFFDMVPEMRPSVARIVFSTETLVNSIWPASQAFYQDVRAWLEARHIDVIGPQALLVSSETPARQATILRVFRTGSEGFFEFYHISPRDIFGAKQGGKGIVSGTPIVGLSVPAALQIGILKWLEDHIEEMRARLALVEES